MKPVFFFLLYLLCFGCSSQATVDRVHNQSPGLTTSTQVTAAATPIPPQTPPDLPVENGSTYTAKGIESKLGVVSRTDAGYGCLRILNATLKVSDEFYSVSANEKPHEVSKLRIKEKLAKSCVDDDSDIGDDEQVTSRSSYYLAELVANDDDATWWSSIAVVSILKAPNIDKGIATAELTGSPPAEYFRDCASNEGAHLTVWTGRPLRGKRIWHRYFYLHYDTDPDCKKQDYEGTDE